MLALVESPYQLNNVFAYFELHGHAKKQHKVIIRDNGNKTQLKQYKNLIEKYQTENITTEFIFFPASGVVRLVYLILLLCRLIPLSLLHKQQVLGDARSILIKPVIIISKLFRKNITLVDDGLYLVNHCKKLGNYPFKIFTSLPITPLEKQKYTVIANNPPKFTAYEAEPTKVFIGQNIVELGFVSESTYLKAVEAFFETATTGESKKVYISHRKESKNKEKKLKELGCEVLNLDLPIEEYFYKNGAPIGLIGSCYSTALINIKMAHERAVFYFCNISLSQASEQVRKNVDNCHKVMKRVGIEELRLEH